MKQSYTSFEDLAVAQFKDSLVFLDIDGTLIADNESEPSGKVLKKVAALNKVAKVWLCSNSLNHMRNAKVKKITRLPLVKGFRKPNKKILTLIPDKDFQLSGKNNRPIIVIGDKVLTDGLFALRIRAKFVKVKRKLGHDRFHIKIYNLIDDIAYVFLRLFV